MFYNFGKFSGRKCARVAAEMSVCVCMLRYALLLYMVYGSLSYEPIPILFIYGKCKLYVYSSMWESKQSQQQQNVCVLYIRRT